MDRVFEATQHLLAPVAKTKALAGREFAVCVGRFYEDLAERLLGGAREGFELAGVPTASVSEA